MSDEVQAPDVLRLQFRNTYDLADAVVGQLVDDTYIVDRLTLARFAMGVFKKLTDKTSYQIATGATESITIAFRLIGNTSFGNPFFSGDDAESSDDEFLDLHADRMNLVVQIAPEENPQLMELDGMEFILRHSLRELAALTQGGDGGS